MKNIIRVVIVSLIGFAFLIYATIPEKNENVEAKFETIPRVFDSVNSDANFSSIFKKDEEKIMVFLDHDAIFVFKDLYKKLEISKAKNIVLIANTSNTPWLFKKIAIEDELEKLYKDSNIVLINDDKARFKRLFSQNSETMSSYFVYKLEKTGKIKFLFQSSVKNGAFQDGISQEEIDKSLDEFLNMLNLN